MTYRAAFCMLMTVVLAACQTTASRPTESMEVKRMRVNGIDLAYVEEGKGETVLFVHGALGDWRTADGVRPWIAPRYRFVSYSWRYHYPDAWPKDAKDYTFNQHVDDLVAFIRALGVGKVHLVGNSYSGRMAGIVALKHPELLRSVVLGDPSLASPTSDEGKSAVAAFQKDMAKSAAAAKAGDSRQAAILLFDAVNQPNTFDKVSPARQQRWLDNANSVGPLFAGGGPAPVSCAELGAIKVPVMVMGGALSRASYRYTDEALLRCLPPGTESFWVPDAHHIWPAENPEAGAQAILNFVSKH